MLRSLHWASVFCAALVLPCAYAHELEENRVTITLRQGNHLSATFHVNYIEVLRRALAPTQAEVAFSLAMATLSPERFASEVERAHRMIEKDVQIIGVDGKPTLLKRWKWPEAAQAHRSLRELTMERIVGQSHVHTPASIITAETELQAVDEKKLSARFPAALHPILLVYYRPTQKWVRGSDPVPLLSD